MEEKNLEYLAVSFISIKIKINRTNEEHLFPEIHSMLFKDLNDGMFYAMALDYTLLVEGNSIEDASNNLFLSIIDLFEVKRKWRRELGEKRMLALAPSEYWDKFRELRVIKEDKVINDILTRIDSCEIDNKLSSKYVKTKEKYYDETLDFLKINSNKKIDYADGIEIIEAKLRMIKLPKTA